MTVSTLVILGLAVVWAVVLLPEAIKKLRTVRSSDSIASFSRNLSHLERANPRVGYRSSDSNVVDLRSRRPRPAQTDAPAAISPAVRRRRQEVLTGLVAAALLTLLCTIAFGGVFLIPHLVADVLLMAYVLCLHQVTNRAPATPHASNRGAASARGFGHVSMGHVSMGNVSMGNVSVGNVSPAARRVAN